MSCVCGVKVDLKALDSFVISLKGVTAPEAERILRVLTRSYTITGIAVRRSGGSQGARD